MLIFDLNVCEEYALSHEWKELYSYVCNDIVSNCNDRDSFTVTMDAINAITGSKTDHQAVLTFMDQCSDLGTRLEPFTLAYCE